MRCLSNSNVESHSAKRVDIASDEYTVDVYRAWKRGWTPQQIRQRAVNGTFHFS